MTRDGDEEKEEEQVDLGDKWPFGAATQRATVHRGGPQIGCGPAHTNRGQ